MNSARAKEILSGYRPGGEHTADPDIISALELVEHDPQLARWFENQQAGDSALRHKLLEIPIPVGLKARILANRPMPRPVQAWWATPSFISHLSKAAVVVLVMGGAFAWLAPFRPATWVDYQAKVLEKVNAPYELAPESREHEVVRREFAKLGTSADYQVPRGLEQYPLEGGFTARYRGHRAAVVCFGSDEQHKPDVWLIVLKQTPLSSAPVDATPRFSRAGRNPIASWAKDGNYYIVATVDGGPDLRTIF